jgi:hypothetical protein
VASAVKSSQKEFPLTETLPRKYKARVLTYLRALDKRLGLLFNSTLFG